MSYRHGMQKGKTWSDTLKDSLDHDFIQFIVPCVRLEGVWKVLKDEISSTVVYKVIVIGDYIFVLVVFVERVLLVFHAVYYHFYSHQAFR